MGVYIGGCGCVYIMPQEKKFVEVGRVVHVTTGPNAGEIGSIVDIIDAKRLLVDGPRMPRCEVKLKDMFLTRILLKIEKAVSHKALLAVWSKSLVDERYKRTVHAQRLEKKAKRAACTDFDYFKVRMASRQINKIVENSVRNLTEKYPRALAKMERKRRIDMGVRLGFRKVKDLTPEEKKVKAAREKIIRENRKVKAQEAIKAKKEARVKRSAARKTKLEAKKKSETFTPRKPLPKDASGKSIRVHNKNKTPTVPHVSSVKAFRRARDSERKEKAQKRQKVTQALQKNRAEIKKAVAAGKTPPRKIKAKAVAPKRSTIKKQINKKQEAKKQTEVAA